MYLHAYLHWKGWGPCTHTYIEKVRSLYAYLHWKGEVPVRILTLKRWGPCMHTYIEKVRSLYAYLHWKGEVPVRILTLKRWGPCTVHLHVLLQPTHPAVWSSHSPPARGREETVKKAHVRYTIKMSFSLMTPYIEQEFHWHLINTHCLDITYAADTIWALKKA